MVESPFMMLLLDVIIYVEDQVSLGAGETIDSKERFEERLYGMACAGVTHLHSNNGVFTADGEDCKGKYQRQYFSDVGAHQQNTQAVRAIQTTIT